MHPLETYIEELRAIRSSGAAVPETAYYPPLANLLGEVGKKLKPRVRCIIHLRDTGGGLPDGGLFTEEQTRSVAADLTTGAIPARGVIEAKPTSADAWKVAESKQVKDYWARYRQVLVTNYRDFLLVGAGDDGNPTVLETYRLARDEREFWQRAAHPRQFAAQRGESLEEFLKRVQETKMADSLAGPIDYTVPVQWGTSHPTLNCVTTPTYGGQWRLSNGGKYMFELVVVSNVTTPVVA